IQEIIPQPKKKIIKELKVAVGILKNKGRYFIQQRPSKGLLGDLWEFPGGKVEKGESVETALKRELKEEIDISVKQAQHLLNVVHFYTQFKVHLHVYYCDADTYPLKTPRQKWVLPQELKQYPMPSGSAKIVDHLLKIDKIL
ncbi:MAG: (deoxy)nucleoside triphosphate pyrophosphohydrolase, partial [Candidatus Omnitrophica bacterium]|nr:(deoxy)nucleoside triphosphate pyrophosphohydrolase [Candidatus Omnitrophota bacterium]